MYEYARACIGKEKYAVSLDCATLAINFDSRVTALRSPMNVLDTIPMTATVDRGIITLSAKKETEILHVVGDKISCSIPTELMLGYQETSIIAMMNAGKMCMGKVDCSPGKIVVSPLDDEVFAGDVRIFMFSLAYVVK